ncbi:MAG: sugar phosphate isomerase/epimerase [Bryobacterales bacterium]|nr:sugar phosphate isomerase/epimerase [Bryobacterales bacterium]
MQTSAISRRLFLASAAAPLLRAAPFSKPIGINLYTVRTSLAKDPEATYKGLADLGITQIEVRAVQLREHAKFIRAAKLQPVHMFVDNPVITGDWEAALAQQRAMARRANRPEPPADGPRPTLTEMASLAKEFGIKRLGLSYLSPNERPQAIAKINEAVEALDKQGMGFYYHNHAFEFDASQGRSFFDRLLADGHPKLTIELDVFWATIGGEDAASLLGKWKGRVASLHVKDVDKAAPRQKNESDMPPAAFKELGAGILDWPKLLRAAADAGTDYYLIEQDMTPGDPLVSVKQSVDFLKSVNL